MSYVWGAFALLGWQCVGILTIYIWRRDLAEETFAALTNMLLWPPGVFMQSIVWPIYKRRRERARQARITAKVLAGEYDDEWARQTLNWKG